MDKGNNKNPKRGKDSKHESDNKKDSLTPKGRMKKPGEKGFHPHEETIGDGSAGLGGTSAI